MYLFVVLSIVLGIHDGKPAHIIHNVILYRWSMAPSTPSSVQRSQLQFLSRFIHVHYLILQAAQSLLSFAQTAQEMHLATMPGPETSLLSPQTVCRAAQHNFRR